MKTTTLDLEGWVLVGCLGLWCGLLNSCTVAAQRQSAEAIRAREPVLFAQSAAYGYVPSNGDRVIWEGPGELLLTPSALYFVSEGGTLGGGSRSLLLSYAAINGVEVGSVRHWRNPPLGNPVSLDHLLLIEPVDGAVRAVGYNSGQSIKRYVFNLTDSSLERSWAADRRLVENTDRPAVSRARSIIAEQRSRVDAFGRTDRGGAWLATRLRPVQTSWNGERIHLQGAAWTEDFDRAARAALRTRAPGFSFRPLDSAQVKWDLMEYGITPAEDLSQSQRDLDRLLVIEMTSLKFRTLPGGRIEASYKLLADFFDLRPAKPAAHFWETYRVTRSEQEWARGGEAVMRADFAEALDLMARKVRARL